MPFVIQLRSLELEQLAVAGQRGVHLWQILSQAAKTRESSRICRMVLGLINPPFKVNKVNKV